MNNDRFKFRVWDKENKTYKFDDEYVEFECYVISTDGTLYKMAKSYGDSTNKKISRDECVIEQCTGLKDKNGKLIYEGDIVDWLGVKFFVDWFQVGFGLSKLSNPKDRSYALIQYDRQIEIEIIGNIHETKE